MFPHARFQTKMVLSFSFILLLVIASFLVFLHYNLFPNLQDDIRSSNRELCVKTSEGLEDYIQKIDDITKKLISNQDLLQILRKAKAGETFNEYEKLNNNRKLSAFIANTIALTGGDLMASLDGQPVPTYRAIAVQATSTPSCKIRSAGKSWSSAGFCSISMSRRRRRSRIPFPLSARFTTCISANTVTLRWRNRTNTCASSAASAAWAT